MPRFILLVGLAFVSGVQAAPKPARTSGGARILPPIASLRDFGRSTASRVDWDQDGKVDFSREFYRSGDVREIRGHGFRIQYDRNGAIERIEAKDSVITYELENGRRVEVTRVFSPDRKLEQKSKVFKTPLGYYKRRTEHYGKNGKAIRFSEQVLEEDSWSAPPDLEPCAPGVTPALDASELEELMDVLEDRIVVDESCNGYRVSPQAEVTHDPESMKELAASALVEGIGCLRKRGAFGQALGDQMLAQLFSSSKRKLTLQCPAPVAESSCPGSAGGADFCGKASPFDDAKFPNIALARDCGMPERGLKAVIFHEAQHLVGTPGRQNVHFMGDIESTEFIEPCARCCQYPYNEESAFDARMKDGYCRMCSDERSPDPVTHHIEYGLMQLNDRYVGTATANLEKGLAIRPDHLEAWEGLLSIYYKKVQDGSASAKERGWLYLAVSQVERLRTETGNPAKARPFFPESEELSSKILRASKRLLEQRYLKEPPPAGVGGLKPELQAKYLEYFKNTEMLQLSLRRCGEMSASRETGASGPESRARKCHENAEGYLQGAKSAIEAMKRQPIDPAGADESGSPQGVISQKALDKFGEATGVREAAIQCLLQGTAVEECPAVLNQPGRAERAQTKKDSCGGAGAGLRGW
jgi:hypothetical protein